MTTDSSNQKNTEALSIPPDGHLMQLLMGKVTTYTISAMARLRIADHMSSELRPTSEIAAASSVHADLLFRVLRVLASLGVVVQQADSFALTQLGMLLQSNAQNSLRDMATMMGDPWTAHSYQRIYQTLQSGTDGVTLAYGKNAFEFFKDAPDQGANFHAAMTSFSKSVIATLLESYDFTGVSNLADVGGGRGVLLASILHRYPTMHGTLFDLPEVLLDAVTDLADLHGRLVLKSGSFFETVPENCDAYLLKHIIHDWDDEACRRILSNIRQKMIPSGRLILIEMLVPTESGPAPAKFLDIEMMANTVGRKERTREEFESLLASARFRLTQIIATRSPVCVIEAVTA